MYLARILKQLLDHEELWRIIVWQSTGSKVFCMKGNINIL